MLPSLGHSLTRVITKSIRCNSSCLPKRRNQLLLPNLQLSFRMASQAPPPPRRRACGKKFVIGCDGTWMNSDAGYEEDGGVVTTQIPSNVTRIIRALDHFQVVDGVKVPQVAFYSKGVGTGNLEDRLLGGLEGQDITEHIREAYAFVANNFWPLTQEEIADPTVPMDEIVILGFSRGAYTARAIADLISSIGLLTRYGMEQFYHIFTDWTNQSTEKESAYLIRNFPDAAKKFQAQHGRPIKFSDQAYVQTLLDAKITRWGMPIRACCCWDTVGSLGVPGSWGKKNVKPLSFVNQKVAKRVEWAFHSLAIDEHRGSFTPTLWESPEPEDPHIIKGLKQTWFPGAHANIGGGYPDALQSNISLAWMVSQLEDHDGGILAFNSHYLDWIQDMALAFYKTQTPPAVRPWGLGKINDSSAVTDRTSLIESVNPITRTPGRYNKVNLDDGTQGKTPLKGTAEAVHLAARIRVDKHGNNPETVISASKLKSALNIGKVIAGVSAVKLVETPNYHPPALYNIYELVESPGAAPYWKAKDQGPGLPEDALGRTERRLLERWVAKAGQ